MHASVHIFRHIRRTSFIGIHLFSPAALEDLNVSSILATVSLFFIELLKKNFFTLKTLMSEKSIGEGGNYLGRRG